MEGVSTKRLVEAITDEIDAIRRERRRPEIVAESALEAQSAKVAETPKGSMLTPSGWRYRREVREETRLRDKIESGRESYDARQRPLGRLWEAFRALAYETPMFSQNSVSGLTGPNIVSIEICLSGRWKLKTSG